METLAAEKFSYGTIKINDEDTVFVQSWKAPLALYAFTNAGVKIEIDRGATYNSDAPMQTSSKTATHPEGTVYYLKDNRIMDSDHSVIFDPSDNGENLYISSFFVSPDQHVFTISYSASLNKYFLKEDGNILLSTGQNLLEVYNISYIEGLRGNGSGEISFVIRDSSPQGVYHLIKYTDDSDPEFLIHITALNLSVSTPNYCDIVGPPDATRCQIVGIKNQSSLSIPFGAHLSLELRDKLGTIIPASFSLVPKTFVLPDISVSSANPTGKIQLEGNSLYPNRIALLFGQDSGKMKQNLITVHMGTQQLMVSPEGKNSISISLISVPARIGNDNNSFDSVIRGRAHKTGFPPQYIKAQIRKEAAGNAFNPNSYRYEPDYDRVRQTPDSLNEIAYARYVFSSAGRAPSNEQVHPRSLYKLYPGLEENRITDNYEYTFNPYKAIKANNIVYEFSNSSQNWYLPKVLSNGTTIPVDYDALEVKLDFVAQTVTASSYGLLQVMYRTAVEARDYFDYQTIDGENFYKRGKDPIALFQPELNLKVGVGYLVKSYRTMNALYQKNISVVNEIETYNDYMSNAFAGYNGSFTKESAEKNKRVLDYKKDVISILPRYLIKF